MATTIISSTQLQADAAAAARTIPDGHTNAVIGTVDQTGAQVIVVAKLGADKNWTVSAEGRHDWSGDNQVGANVIYSW